MPNDGGPAFPSIDELNPGMSLRDYFAGQVLSSMKSGEYRHYEDMATEAYSLADALLAERSKHNQGGDDDN